MKSLYNFERQLHSCKGFSTATTISTKRKCAGCFWVGLMIGVTYVSRYLWASWTCCASIVPWRSVGSLVAVPDRLEICSNCEHLVFWQLLENGKTEKWKIVSQVEKNEMRYLIYARTRCVRQGIYMLSIWSETSPKIPFKIVNFALPQPTLPLS